MIKVVAFTGETFRKFDGLYYASQTSADFIQKTFGDDNVKFISSSSPNMVKPTDYSSCVKTTNFYESLKYTSTKDFILQCIKRKGFYNQFVNNLDCIINENSDSIFWVRTPSIGSVIFGLRVLKKNKKLINHMCANFSKTWMNDKYGKIERVFGFLVSKVLSMLLKKICINDNTINFTTGDELEQFSKKYSKKTYQFVDLMVSKKEVNKFDLTNIQHAKNLTFVGRIVKDKGVFDLVDILSKLPLDINLNIVGGGPDYQELSKLIRFLDLTDRVKLWGQLPFDDLEKIYKNTDITIVPSNNYYEGFPRVIMESWSYSIPVIVSDVGGVRAFVKNGINGLIYQRGSKEELFNAINKVHCDYDLFIKLKYESNKMKDVSNFKYWSTLLYESTNNFIKS